MHKITVDNIMAHKPCEEYPKERVEELWGGKESLSLLDILDLNIPAEDRIRAVTWFLSDAENRYFARWCALQVIHLWDCPGVAKRYLVIGDEGLREGCLNAARADAQFASGYSWCSRACAMDAAARAAWVAASSCDHSDGHAKDANYSAYAANCAVNFGIQYIGDRDVERPKQIEKLKEMVK